MMYIVIGRLVPGCEPEQMPAHAIIAIPAI
jgi:hypothetical protein